MKQDYPSMLGKTCLVTGGSSGIGKATALALARLDADVILVNSNRQRGLAALDEIKQKSGNPKIHLYTANLSSQTEIRQLAGQIKADFSQLHLLINVAGSMFRGIHYSADGLEMNFALNYLSGFMLANLLMDMLIKSAPARIINVSSVAHWWGHINMDEIAKPRYYSMFSAYGNSKLAIILFTREQAERLQNTGVTAYSIHPGIVSTNIIQKVIDQPLINKLANLLFLSPEKSAEKLVWLATSENVNHLNGEFFVKNKPGWCSKASHDMSLAQRLWTFSEECTHLKNTLPLNVEKSEELCV